MSKRKKHTLTISEAAKKKLALNLPYCMIGLYATKLGQAWRMAEGTNLSEKAAAPGRWLCLRFCFVAAEFPSCRSARRSVCRAAAPSCRVSQKQRREEVPQRT